MNRIIASFVVILLCLFTFSSCCTTKEKNDDFFDISADQFQMKPDGTVEAIGNVKVTSKSFMFNTPRISYNKTSKVIRMKGPVELVFTNISKKVEKTPK